MEQRVTKGHPRAFAAESACRVRVEMRARSFSASACKPYLSILPPLDFDWQVEIDQSCLEERQREHVARCDPPTPKHTDLEAGGIAKMPLM